MLIAARGNPQSPALSDSPECRSFLDNTRPVLVFLQCKSKPEGSVRPSIILADLLGNRSLLQQVQKVMVCDLWLVYFDLFCVSLCFKVRCFWTSEFACFHALGLLALSFFYLPTEIWQVASLDSKGEYSASKSSRNTDLGGWKRIDTFPTIFNFATSARYYHCYLTGKDWMLWYMLKLMSKKNLKSWSVLDNAGRELSKRVVKWQASRESSNKKKKFKKINSIPLTFDRHQQKNFSHLHLTANQDQIHQQEINRINTILSIKHTLGG